MSEMLSYWLLYFLFFSPLDRSLLYLGHYNSNKKLLLSFGVLKILVRDRSPHWHQARTTTERQSETVGSVAMSKPKFNYQTEGCLHVTSVWAHLSSLTFIAVRTQPCWSLGASCLLAGLVHSPAWTIQWDVKATRPSQIPRAQGAALSLEACGEGPLWLSADSPLRSGARPSMGHWRLLESVENWIENSNSRPDLVTQICPLLEFWY
jgi:hypothetical protein